MQIAFADTIKELLMLAGAAMAMMSLCQQNKPTRKNTANY